MIDRFANLISAGLHLGIILLLGTITFEMQAPLIREPGMELEIIDVQHAMPEQDPQLADASMPESSDVPPSSSVVQQVPAVPAPIMGMSQTKPAEAVAVSVNRAPVPKPAPAPSPVPTPAPKAEVPASAASAPPHPPVTQAASQPVRDAKLDARSLSRSLKAESSASQSQRLNSATIGSAVGKAAPRGVSGLTFRQKVDLAQRVREQVMPCWNPPADQGPTSASVRLRFRLDREGRVVTQPVQSSVNGRTAVNAAYINMLTSSGRRAIMMCAPLRLPPELYEAWEEVEVEFDPRELR